MKVIYILHQKILLKQKRKKHIAKLNTMNFLKKLETFSKVILKTFCLASLRLKGQAYLTLPSYYCIITSYLQKKIINLQNIVLFYFKFNHVC